MRDHPPGASAPKQIQDAVHYPPAGPLYGAGLRVWLVGVGGRGSPTVRPSGRWGTICGSFIKFSTSSRLCKHPLREEYPERNICTKNADANAFLRNLQEDWNSWRGVLFLDPFSTEVDWATVVKIAGFNALDTWILFPASSLGRVLPKSKVPEDISDKWADCLTRIFGDQSWKKLYSENPQQSFWGDVQFQRDPGVDGIIKLYKAKLRSLFGRRLMEESKSFANSRNSHMFEFMFCVGSNNEKTIGLAKRIAGHILNAST